MSKYLMLLVMVYQKRGEGTDKEVVSVHTVRAYRGRRITAPVILNVGATCR
jgi:hypothetical protein